jgi:hypothetical protein
MVLRHAKSDYEIAAGACRYFSSDILHLGHSLDLDGPDGLKKRLRDPKSLLEQILLKWSACVALIAVRVEVKLRRKNSNPGYVRSS